MPLVPLTATAQTRRLAPPANGSAPPAPVQPATKTAPIKLPAPVVPQAVNIVATKTDNRTSAQPVGPTNTINYTVTIQNTGTTDATAVVLNDTIDPNTTLVPGSIAATPLANADAYSVIGNVRIQPNAAQGLLANDSNPDNGNNTGLTASGPTTTTQGGNLTINADGSFSYNPKAGFAGTDTFTYTTTVTATGKTDTGTVTLSVGNGTGTLGTNVIWFVDPAAASGGDGRLTSPFNCYTGASASCFSTTAADDPGDAIFLYSGAHVGGNTLLNTQKLIGAGATDTLANLAGVTVQPYSNALPATGGTSPTITTTNVNAIPLGQDNTLRGFTVGNTGTGAKIFGSNFGTLTAGNVFAPDVVLNGTGAALNLTNGAFSAASGFNGVTTTSSATGTAGIALATIAGTVSFGATNVSNSGTQGINISGSTMTATFSSTTVSSSGAQGILVGTTSGTINFSNTTVTGGTDGVSFQNNSGANARTFGTLGVSGGSGNAFLHGAGGGNVTVNGAATLSSAGDPVEIANAGSGQVISFVSGASVTRTASGGEGVHWSGTNTGATLTFNALTVTTTNGTGI